MSIAAQLGQIAGFHKAAGGLGSILGGAGQLLGRGGRGATGSPGLGAAAGGAGLGSSLLRQAGGGSGGIGPRPSSNANTAAGAVGGALGGAVGVGLQPSFFHQLTRMGQLGQRAYRSAVPAQPEPKPRFLPEKGSPAQLPDSSGSGEGDPAFQRQVDQGTKFLEQKGFVGPNSGFAGGGHPGGSTVGVVGGNEAKMRLVSPQEYQGQQMRNTNRPYGHTLLAPTAQ